MSCSRARGAGCRASRRSCPRLAELGFDVIYLPPIHPIGLTNRKGRDNALTAGPDDPGSPVGDRRRRRGGHDAIHPELGTIDDVRALTAAAAEHDIDIALDFAIQCSADHPWLTEHPEWFHRRPDGTLKYAENPPKRYQDIYNVNWESPDWRGLWDALLRRRCCSWVDCGVTVFRVDNPHTKPFAFWAWLIDEVHARDRDVIFLAEAFTKRAVMRHLAKIGFSQSYTYFTWKNARWELTEYVSELAYSRRAGVLPPQLLRQHPGHPARVPPARRPRRRSRRGSCWRRRSAPATGSTPAIENFENVPVRGRAPRSTCTPRSTRSRQRALDGPLLPLIARAQRDPPREPGAAGALERHLPGHRQRGADRLRQADRGRHVDLRGQPRPPPAPRRAR